MNRPCLTDFIIKLSVHPEIALLAGIAALEEVPDEMLTPLVAQLQVKRDFIVNALQQLPNVECRTPQGAFYAFPDVSFYLGKGARSKQSGRTVDTSTDLCT